MKFPDDMLFEQFNRPDEDDFGGLAKMIAERLRAGIDSVGAKWLAELFDPIENKAPYRVEIFRPDARTKKGEMDARLEFELFKSLLDLVDYDYLKAKDIARQEPPSNQKMPPNIRIDDVDDYIRSLNLGEGLGMGVNKATRIAKSVREYLDVKQAIDFPQHPNMKPKSSNG